MIDMKTVEELEQLCERARAAAEMFTEALKDQAEKHQLEAPALRRFVVARVTDKVGKLSKELQTFDQLGLFEPTTELSGPHDFMGADVT